MADLAGLKVSIDGSDAIRTAQQVGDAVTKMGASATTAQKAFTELQSTAGKPIAPQANTVTGLLASLERARQVYAQMVTEAEGFAQLGGPMVGQFTQVAASAAEVGAALQSVRGIVSDMISQGAGMEEIYKAVQEQIAMLPSGMERFDAATRSAFASLYAGMEKELALTKEYKDAENAVIDSIQKEQAAHDKTAAAAVAAREKEAAAAQAAVDKQIKDQQRLAEQEDQIQRRQATRRGAQAAMQQGPFGAVTGTMMNVMMGAQMMGTGGPMGGMMGIQMLGAGLTEASAGAATFGVAFGGLIAAVAAGIAVLAAAAAAVKLVSDALKEAGTEEKLSIQLKNVYGSAQQATQAMSDLKTFSQSATGGIFNLSDLEAGEKQLLLLTGGFINLKEVMPEVANAAAESGKSFEAEASQVARVYSAIQTGNPVRAMLIQQLVSEGAISEATRVKIENMNKAHASAASMLQAFINGLKEGGNAAEQMGNTVDGLGNRIKNAFQQNFLAPLGAAFEPVIKQLEQGILGLLQGHEADIKNFADSLERNLLTAFFLVRDQGVLGALGTALQGLGQSLEASLLAAVKVCAQNFQTELTAVWTTVAAAVTTAIWPAFQKMGNDFVLVLGRLNDPAFWSAMGTALNNIADAFVKLLNVGIVAIITALQKAWTTPPGSLPGPGNIPRPQPATSFLGLTSDQQKALDAQNAAINKNNTAVDQATAKQQDQAKQVTQTTTDTKSLGDAFNQLKTQLGNFVSTLGAQMTTGGFAPGVGTGPTQVLSEWVAGEARTQANQQGPLRNQLQVGDVALSLDKMQQLFGTTTVTLQQFVDIVTQSGTLLHQRVADISYRSAGVPNINTVELWGRPGISGGATVRASGGVAQTGPMAVGAASGAPVQTQTQLTALEKAQKEADDAIAKDKADAAKSTQGMLGTMPGVVDNTKKGAAAAKLMDDEIKAATTAIAAYGAKITIINEQEKAGQISLITAEKEKATIYQQEITYIEKTIATLKQQEQAAKTANPTADVTKYDDAIQKLNNDLAKTKQAMTQVQQINPWTSFTQGVQQAVNKWGDFNTQFTDLGKQMTDQLASGLTAGLTALESGTGKASDAFKQMAMSIINDIQQMVVHMLIMEAVQALFPGGGGGGAGGASAGIAQAAAAAFAHQSGGLVYGPSGTDKVASNLTAGEYVITKSAVDKYGIQMLDLLNQGQLQVSKTAGRATGGYVNAGTSPMNAVPSAESTGGSGGAPVTISTTVNVAAATAGPSTGGSGGMSKQDAQQMQTIINNAIKQEIAIQKRPGGLLNRTTAG